MATPKELQDAWEAVDKALNHVLDEFVPEGSRRTIRRQQKLSANRKLISDHLAALGTAAPRDGGTLVETKAQAGSSNIQSFFEAIGEGVRAAQENLDHQSIDYIRKRPAFAPETMFRLPKVSANLRLGLRQTSQSGIDFFVFEKSETTSEFVEQEISFEVTAAHPPPDLLEATAELPIGQIIATNAADRKEAHDRLGANTKLSVAGSNEAANAAKEMHKKEAFRRVLVFRGPEKFVLLSIPSEAERQQLAADVAATILAVPVAAGSQDTALLIKRNRSDPRTSLLFEILATVADRQASLLAQLDRI